MKKGGSVAGWVLLGIYIVVLVDVLFLMRGTHVRLSELRSDSYGELLKQYAKSAFNPVPFKTIRSYWYMVRQYGIGGGNRIWWQNLAGNLVLFLPMGCLLPILFPRFRSFPRTVLFTVFLVLCVEGLQLLTFTGSCDVDDLILNVTGCVIGYFLYKVLLSWRNE